MTDQLTDPLQFHLRKTQTRIWEDTQHKIILHLGGLGSGKTALLAYLMMRADPTIRHMLVAATYKQVHEGVIPNLEEHWEAAGLRWVYGCRPPVEWVRAWKHDGIKVPKRGVRASNTLIFETGQHFVVTGLDGESYRRTKGPSYGQIFGDEIPELGSSKPLDFILPRMRCGKAPYCDHHHAAYLFGNPPPSYDPHWIRDWHKRLTAMNDRARAAGKAELYAFYSASTYENIAAVGEDYVELVSASIPEGAGDAWINGILTEFKSATTTYHAWTSANVIPVAYDPMKTLHVSMDFNVEPASATLGHLLTDDEVPEEYRGRGLIHVGTFGELSMVGDAASAALRLCRGGEGLSVPENFTGLKDHRARIAVYGDASGGMRRAESRDLRSAWAQVSDVIAANVGPTRFLIDVPKANPSQHDSVFRVNQKIHADNGDRSYWVDPRCENLKADFEHVVPSPDGLDLISKKDPKWTHWTDCERYRIMRLDPHAGKPAGQGPLAMLKAMAQLNASDKALRNPLGFQEPGFTKDW